MGSVTFHFPAGPVTIGEKNPVGPEYMDWWETGQRGRDRGIVEVEPGTLTGKSPLASLGNKYIERRKRREKVAKFEARLNRMSRTLRRRMRRKKRQKSLGGMI